RFDKPHCNCSGFYRRSNKRVDRKRVYKQPTTVFSIGHYVENSFQILASTMTMECYEYTGGTARCVGPLDAEHRPNFRVWQQLGQFAEHFARAMNNINAPLQLSFGLFPITCPRHLYESSREVLMERELLLRTIPITRTLLLPK